MAAGAILRGIDFSGFGFKEVSHVGHGQSGSAHLVEEAETGQIFVAKCMSMAALTQRDQAMAHQEVSLLQQLHHPLVVAYHDSFLVEGTNMLVILMEYCQGGDLRKLITSKADAGEHFSEEQVMTWFVQVLLALQYVHSEKVLHRDLKTSNIFLSADSKLVKLGDFGIARVLGATCEAANTVVGTPYYMSPEVCRSEPYNWKSDVWAAGCVLYELCALKHAFESASLVGLVYKIVSEQCDPIPPFYSAELHDLLGLLLSKSADSRPSVEEVLRHPFVKGYLDQQIPSIAASSSKAPPPRREPRLVPPVPELASPMAPIPELSRLPEPRTSSRSAGSRAGPEALALPEAFVLGPQTAALVIGSRIQSRVVAGYLRWIAVFASLDTGGEKALSPKNMQSALATLQVGLSREEIVAFVEAITQGSKVTLSGFEQKLAEANTSLEVLQIRTWARNLLEPLGVQLTLLLTGRDKRQDSALSVAEFHAAVQDLLPDATPEHLEVLTLLADKSESGEVDCQRFIKEYAPSSAEPLAPWPSHLGAPPPPPPPPPPPDEQEAD